MVAITDYEGSRVIIELEDFHYEGKLVAKRLEDEKLLVKVKRGRGQGRVYVRYKVRAELPKKEGTINAKITMYKVDIKTQEKVSVMQPITVKIVITKPIEIEEIRILPHYDIYFVGDTIKIKATLTSKYAGGIYLSINGAGIKDENIYYEVRSPYTKIEYKKEYKLTKKDREIKLDIYIPEILYKERKSIAVNVIKPPRTLVDIEGFKEKPIIGKHAELRLKIKNRSASTEVNAKITALIYNYGLEYSVTLKPLEEKKVILKTPILTQESTTNTRGFIKILEEPGLHEYVREIILPTPSQLPITLKPETSTPLNIYSSDVLTFSLKIINNLDIPIQLMVDKVKSKICKVQLTNTEVTVNSKSPATLNLQVIPKNIGKDNITIAFKIAHNGLTIATRKERYPIEIKPSFTISRVRVKELKTDQVVVSQNVKLELDITYKGKVRTKLKVEGNKAIKTTVNNIPVVQGVRSYILDGTIVDHGKPCITVTDGVYGEKVEIPLKVVKPYVNFYLDTKEIYGGIPTEVECRLENPLAIPIIVKPVIIYTRNLDILEPPSELKEVIPPYGTRRHIIKMVGLKKGEATAKIAILSSYREETSKKEYVVKLNVRDPINIYTSTQYREIKLPYPTATEIYGKKNIALNVELSIRNISNRAINNINVSIRSSQNIILSKNKCTISILPENKVYKEIIEVKTPINYARKSVSLTYELDIGGKYKDNGDLISIKTSYINYVPMVYHRRNFTTTCPYPYRLFEEYVETLLPGDFDPLVYGEPLEVMLELRKLITDIAMILDKVKTKAEGFWRYLAKTFYLRISDPKYDFRELLAKLNEIDEAVGDVIISPILFWKALVYKVFNYQGEVTKLRNRIKSYVPGIIMLPLGSLGYSINRELYSLLINIILYDNEKDIDKLRSYLSKLKNRLWEYGTISLIYALYANRPVDYDKGVADRLHNNNLEEYLMYIASTLYQWIKNKEELKRLKEIIARKNFGPRGLFALAILYLTIITRNFSFKPFYSNKLFDSIIRGE